MLGDVSDDLLLIPGPTTLSHRVREVMARPQLGHISPEFIEAMKELLDLTRFVFKAQTGQPFVITGSGSVAMECVAVSLIEPGDRVLVLDTGAFGKRFALMLEIHGAKVDVVTSTTGRHADPTVAAEKLTAGGFKAVFATHVDTSSTVVNPVAEIVEVARSQDVLSVIDSVCGVGGLEFDFDRLGSDVALTASQKALAAPPGAALLVLSDRAIRAMEQRKTPIRSYYMDLLRWKKVMEDPGVYLSTPATQVMLALREALRIIREEGLERRWFRHRVLAEGIRAGFGALDLGFVAEEGFRADTVTGILMPDSRAREVQRLLREQFRIQVALGFGELREKALRIGHFGNLKASDVVATLSAVESVLRRLDGERKPGAAAQVALPYLDQLLPDEKT